MKPGDVVIVLNAGNLVGPHANIHDGALGVAVDTKNMEIVGYTFVQTREARTCPAGVWVRTNRLESLGAL